jgi:ABC-type transport system substrate-binding protein
MLSGAAALLIACGGLLTADSLAETASGPARHGGEFRIVLADLDSLDPARSYRLGGWTLLDATCARLMTYPDKRPPAGSRIVPEVAARPPEISRDGKTYTFTLRQGRRGFFFSDGSPVRASAFARAINRVLTPAMRSPGAAYARDIRGAADVLAGKATVATGVEARGNRLIIRFMRPVRDFAARTTMPFFCAVPPSLPANPEGVGRIPGAGPYYVSDYRPGERVVLLRNRFYGGSRPRHSDRFEVDLRAGSSEQVLDRVERGQADWGATDGPAPFDPARRLAAKYGVNKSRFWVHGGAALRGFALNTSRRLFRDNPRLRRAINLAVDRPALIRALGSPLSARPTDQYLPPAIPGFRDASIYPLKRPNVVRARALARGRTRGGRAVLYTFSAPAALAVAQVLKQNLAAIGLDLEIRGYSRDALLARLATPGEPYDIAVLSWIGDYLDPYSFINLLLDGRLAGDTNSAWFDSPRYNAQMRRAASLQGAARYRAYSRLDASLAHDAAPLVAISVPTTATLVSRRVGCIVIRTPPYGLDLPAACLKR